MVSLNHSAGPAAFDVRNLALKLLAYCRDRNWAGWDPYDALNSRIFGALPVLDAKWPRLILTQILKRSPVNIRPWLLIRPSQNPKGLALFLQALIKMNKAGMGQGQQDCELLVRRIAELRSPDANRWCWGYSFPWQTRTHLVPRGAPNLVCTTFVAEALLDYFEAGGGEHCLRMALGAAEYIVDELYWTDGEVSSFSYPFPTSRTPVHNANLLAAALLCRLREHSRKLVPQALKVARYSVKRQKADGSWAYGESEKQGWIDNFHTGFNLCALRRIGEFLHTREFEQTLARGFEFYRLHFFTADGGPKYFHNRALPFDVHSAAQSLITLTELGDASAESLSLAEKVLNWTLANLWDEREFFCYQKRSWGRIRIPYMRWGEAWMLLALTIVIEQNSKRDALEFSEGGKLQSDVTGVLK